MSAALIDLVSVGAQDVFITGDPQVSFFRQNYKRHTNFAIKPERMEYIGTFDGGNEITIPIRSKGDLMSYIWIEAQNIADVQSNGSGLFASGVEPTEFSLWIGGQKVTQLDSLFVQGVHNPLMRDTSAKASCALTTNVRKENHSADYYVLPFFFGEDWTKVLPLVALQYHDVEIRLKLRPNYYFINYAPKVFGTYIYLDTEERKFFTDTEHEILFTQVQHQLAAPGDTDIDLTYFNHPVKSLHLVSGKATGSSYKTEYTFDTSSLYINGTPLFENTTNVYHHDVVPHMHCTDLPDDVLDDLPTFSWPFCLTMSKMQPTGTLNFSRIDTAKLVLNSPSGGNAVHRVYAVNYNVLRIKQGMGGVALGK